MAQTAANAHDQTRIIQTIDGNTLIMWPLITSFTSIAIDGRLCHHIFLLIQPSKLPGITLEVCLVVNTSSKAMFGVVQLTLLYAKLTLCVY